MSDLEKIIVGAVCVAAMFPLSAVLTTPGAIIAMSVVCAIWIKVRSKSISARCTK